MEAKENQTNLKQEALGKEARSICCITVVNLVIVLYKLWKEEQAKKNTLSVSYLQVLTKPQPKSCGYFQFFKNHRTVCHILTNKLWSKKH